MKRAAWLIAVLSLAGCSGKPDATQDKDQSKDKAAANAPAATRTSDPLLVRANAELQAQVKLEPLASSEVREALRVSGRIEANQNRMARVGSTVNGRITDMHATVGQGVQRGEVLATIHSTELSTAQLGYLKAQSQRELAARAASRARQLLEADVIGSAELQRRESELSMAEAELAAAADQLRILGMSSASVAKLAQTRSIQSVSQIMASVSGTVIERKVTLGQVVQPADPIYLVADLASIWAVADIPEQNVGAVRPGEEVSVEVAALPGRPFVGQLSFVSPVVNPQTRTVQVRLDLPNPQGELKPDMLASVLIRGRPQARLTVPLEAVVREENRDYLFVRAGADSFRLQPVELGGEHDGRRVVLGGVRAGEAVVVAGAFHLNNERKRQALEAR